MFRGNSTSVPKSINTVLRSGTLAPAGDPDSDPWSTAFAPDEIHMRRRYAAAPLSRLTSTATGEISHGFKEEPGRRHCGVDRLARRRACRREPSPRSCRRTDRGFNRRTGPDPRDLRDQLRLCHDHPDGEPQHLRHLHALGGTGTYMTALADAYSIARQDNYCNVNPSLPNYLCLSGARDLGCSGYDGDPNSNGCTSSAWNSENIIDRILGAGLTWKAYMEDMPSNCYTSDSGNYAVRHNPFVYYNDIVSNSTRCNQVVPAGTAGSALVADLASTSTASNYMWFTPNTCNDMHDCDIPTGDTYLSVLVPLILGSNVFLTQRAALLLTFDEGYGQPIYTVWAGPVVKTAYTSSTAHSHYSVLSTIESNWNLPSLTTNDQNATNMNEFFTTPTGPDFSLSANPSTVTFVAGQSATSTISLHPMGGFNGTVALNASSSPAGITSSCVPSNISGSQSSTCTFTGSATRSYTVTITGRSGSLVHTTSIGVTVTAPPIPDFSIAANPTTVSFVAGQSASSTISLQSTGGFAGTVSLTAVSSPPAASTSGVPSSITRTPTSTRTLRGAAPRRLCGPPAAATTAP